MPEDYGKKVLYDTKFLQLKSAKSPMGKEWVYAHRPNASDIVIILPWIKKDNKDYVLFIRELRPPLYAERRSKYNIGLPAGLVGDERIGESVTDAIKAELLEETGLVADSIEIVAKNVSSSSGCTSEVSTIAIAKISNPLPVQEPVSDGGILVERMLIEFKDILNFLNSEQEKGNSISGQTLAALFFLKNLTPIQ